MPNVIYKYPINPLVTDLHLPSTADVLSVGSQGEQVVLWALLNPDHSVARPRRFHAMMTGQKFEIAMNRLVFVGTTQMDDGIVVHVFEEVDPA